MDFDIIMRQVNEEIARDYTETQNKMDARWHSLNLKLKALQVLKDVLIESKDPELCLSVAKSWDIELTESQTDTEV
jgi:hypothetical protein